MVTAIASHEVWCPYVPVEIAGTLGDGRHFYFRARYDEASLSLSDESPAEAMDHSVERPAATRQVGAPDGYAAGYLTYDEAMQMIADMLAELPP